MRKDGTYKSTQRYKCILCGIRFRAGHKITAEEVWEHYLHGKQTVAEISAQSGVSPSTIKRLLATVSFRPMGQNGCFSARKTPIRLPIGHFGC